MSGRQKKLEPLEHTIAERGRRNLIKSFVQSYQATRHGHAVTVGGYQGANAKAIEHMLAKRLHQADQAPELVTTSPLPAGEPPPLVTHAAKEGPASRDKHGDRTRRRGLLEDAHGHLELARKHEGQAAAGHGNPAEHRYQAETLRQGLAGAMGADYERVLEGKLLKVYEPEVVQRVADWARKIGLKVERDTAGHPSGNFGQLVAEGMGQAYTVMHRHDASHKTPLLKKVLGAVEQHLLRHWRDALGTDAGGSSQRERDLIVKMAKYQHEFYGTHGDMPGDMRLARHLGVELERVGELKQRQAEMYASHLTAMADGDDGAAGEIDVDVVDRKVGPADMLERNETEIAVHGAIASLDSPLKQAVTMLKYEMELTPPVVAGLVETEHLQELAQANREAAARLGAGALEDIARAAGRQVAGARQLDPAEAARMVAVAHNLLKYGNNPLNLLLEPDTSVEGVYALQYSELVVRLGYPKTAAGSILRTAMIQLAKQPAIAALGEAMAKSLTDGCRLPGARLLRDLGMFYADALPAHTFDGMAKSVRADLAPVLLDLFHDLVETHPDTGIHGIRAGANEETAIFLAAFACG
jgi:hypothetical protein